MLKSENLDYCLIEFDAIDDSLLDLPLLAPENIGCLEYGTTEVIAPTGSGNIIMGTLSRRRFSIRLPKSPIYIDTLVKRFESFLQKSDSGSPGRDTKTGMIYGHIVAGDTKSQNAIIVLAVDVFRVITENPKWGFTATPTEVHGISQSSILRPPSFGVETYHRMDSKPYAAYNEFRGTKFFAYATGFVDVKHQGENDVALRQRRQWICIF